MSETQIAVIEPDIGFVRQIMESGGDTLKKCFQCGNCTAVCDVTADTDPFPRKEMVWAQWGLKDKLLADPNIWLCHQCNDCTTHCPRGAKPGDVFAAIRNISFGHYGAFGLGKLFASPKFTPLLFLIPVVWIGIVISIAAKEGFMRIKPIVFSNMISVPAIDTIFLPVVGFASIAAIMGVISFWKNISANATAPSTGAIISGAISSAIGVLKHDKMGKCVVNASRFRSHMALMYGFIALMVTTGLVAVMYWINKLGIAEVAVTPLDLSHPVKILGNIGALLAFVGITLVIIRRFGPSKDEAGVTGFYDQFFLATMFWTIVTGILSQIFRLGDMAALAFVIYYIHLIFVFTLLAYLPFSKFSHLLYRFAAMTYASAMEIEKRKDE